MNQNFANYPQLPLRSPQTVMRLARMGAFHQCPLSFKRTLLRKLQSEKWRMERTQFEIDAQGVGHAVYTVHGPDDCYSLVCFGHDLPPEQRSDRVIAQAWDATFALMTGRPDRADIERLSQNVPKQEGGRLTQRELTMSRANRSVRLFEHVLERLACGQQPDLSQITEVGYLMRTTAVYGAGKFGAADLKKGAQPFELEMLTVYLIRAFTLDLVEHMAHCAAPDRAVAIDPKVRRMFGVGNSTGLGMAPFVINHPTLLNNWITARETALARIRSRPWTTQSERATFHERLNGAIDNTANWFSQHPLQNNKIKRLCADLSKVKAQMESGLLHRIMPWNDLYEWAEATLSLEGQEQVVSLMLEPFNELTSELTQTMGADEEEAFLIDGQMPIETLRAILHDQYSWTLDIDWSASQSKQKLWYVSADKQEPRLADRYETPLEPYEQPLAPGRDAAALLRALTNWHGGLPIADFLAAHPEHRHSLRRVQMSARFPYGEIRDNTIDADMLPIDLLRCKLSFFGATRFDPRSDRWVRITMFQNAPFPNELAFADSEAWAYGTSDASETSCIH